MTDFRTACQRRLGLYVSALTNTLDERGNDAAPTSHSNTALATMPFTAPTPHTTTTLAYRPSTPPTHAQRYRRRRHHTPGRQRRRHTRLPPPKQKRSKTTHAPHINNGHIPDMYRLGSPHKFNVYKFKCYTPFRGTRGALGNSSQRCVGPASTSDGHSFAFGNTEETLRASVYGLTARGAPHDPPP